MINKISDLRLRPNWEQNIDSHNYFAIDHIQAYCFEKKPKWIKPIWIHPIGSIVYIGQMSADLPSEHTLIDLNAGGNRDKLKQLINGGVR